MHWRVFKDGERVEVSVKKDGDNVEQYYAHASQSTWERQGSMTLRSLPPRSPSSSKRHPAPAEPAPGVGSAVEAASGAEALPVAALTPADWRRRVHAARRRVILIVRTAIRLQRGTRRVRRPNRHDGMGFLIKQTLGADAGRFLEEHRLHGAATRALQQHKVSLDAALLAAGSAATAAAGCSSEALGRRAPSCTDSLDSGSVTSGRLGSQPSSNTSSASPSAWVADDDHHLAKPVTAAASAGRDRSPSAPQQQWLLPPPAAAAAGAIAPTASYLLRSISDSPGRVETPPAPATSSSRSPPGGTTAALPAGAAGPALRRRGEVRRATDEGHAVVVGTHQRPATNTGLPSVPSSQAALPGLPSVPRLRPRRSTEPENATISFPPPLAVSESLPTLRSLAALATTSSQKQVSSRPAFNRFTNDSIRVTTQPRQAAARHVNPRSQWPGKSVTEPGPTPALAPQEVVAELNKLIEEQSAVLSRANRMLQMYVNRCNAVWPSTQAWAPPAAQGPASRAYCQETDGVVKQYSSDVVRKLQAGQMALQLFVANDYLPGKDCIHPSCWMSDPWELVEACRPGLVPLADRLKGLPVGARILINLVTQLQALAGQAAVDSFVVILHVDDEQRAEVVRDLVCHRFYGLQRSNVLLLSQRRVAGYRYRHDERQFVEAPALGSAGGSASTSGTSGSGHGLMQLMWASEACTVGDDHLPVVMDESVLELLSERGVEWLISRRARDLSLLTREGGLDLAALSHALRLSEQQQQQAPPQHACNLFTELLLTDDHNLIRAYDSVVLCNTATAESGEAGAPKRLSELRFSELATPHMQEVVRAVRDELAGRLPLSLQRYIIHVPSLRRMSPSLAAFRPKLTLSKDHVAINTDIADTFAHAGARCVALHAAHHHGVLGTQHGVECLVPVLKAQDQDASLRLALEAFVIRAVTFVSSKHDDDGGASALKFAVFVDLNPLASCALAAALTLAKSADDKVVLVTWASSAHYDEAQAFLHKLQKDANSGSMVDVCLGILPLGGLSLVECVEQYVVANDVDVVVMGSRKLTSSSPLHTSVTLAVVKRVSVPVVVVTTHSRSVFEGVTTSASAAPGGGRGVSALALVDHHSLHMVGWVTSRLLSSGRIGRPQQLVLAKVNASYLSAKQIERQRGLMDASQDVAIKNRVRPSRSLVMDGDVDRCLLGAAADHHCNLVAMAVPTNSKALPSYVSSVIRSCRGAVLLYKADYLGLPKHAPPVKLD